MISVFSSIVTYLLRFRQYVGYRVHLLKATLVAAVSGQFISTELLLYYNEMRIQTRRFSI